MKKQPELLTYFLEDILEWDMSFSVKSMFWGYGIYRYWILFAIYSDDRIYFKVDDSNREEYVKYKSKPFEYTKKWWITTTLSYYEIPEVILEDREEILKWIEKSLIIKSKKWYQKKK